MDPNSNLAEMRYIADGFVDGDYEEDALKIAKAERLAELVQALDEWLSRGGFLPKPWAIEPNNIRTGGRS